MRHPRDLNLAGLEVNDEEDKVANEAMGSENLDAEEVCSPDGSPMSLKEGFPGCALATLRRWLQAMLDEDVLDGAAADGGSQVHQAALNAAITPTGVLPRHLEYQVDHLLLGPGASGSAAPRSVVLPGDQASVPAQDGLGSDDASDLFEDLAAQDLFFDSEATALIIAQTETSIAHLLAEDTVLLQQIFDDISLLAVDPGGKRDEEELEGRGARCSWRGESACGLRNAGVNRTSSVAHT